MKPQVYTVASDCAKMTVSSNEINHDTHNLSFVLMDRYELETLRASIYSTLMEMDAVGLIANDSWSVGGPQKELCQCSDLDVPCEECCRLNWDCKGGKN